MISERKLASVRANGRRSTGPRSSEGRARASDNARRHGLSLAVMSDPRLEAEARELAERIAGARADLSFQALDVAAAQVDLQRVRRLRHERIATALRNLEQQAGRDAACVGDALEDILGILRTIKSKATAGSPTIARLEKIAAQRAASRAQRKAVDLPAMIAALARLDRYERLCLGRRKTAIRRLDGCSC